jgi:hypothetical protein
MSDKRDIVERLRDPMIVVAYGDRLMAADEIERLRAAEAAMRERCAAFVMDRSKKASSLRQLAKRRADADAEQVFVQLWKELEMMAHNISSLPLSGNKP